MVSKKITDLTKEELIQLVYQLQKSKSPKRKERKVPKPRSPRGTPRR